MAVTNSKLLGPADVRNYLRAALLHVIMSPGVYHGLLETRFIITIRPTITRALPYLPIVIRERQRIESTPQRDTF